MNVFDLCSRLVQDYSRCTRSFIKISDPLIRNQIDSALDGGVLCPESLLQLNPSFQSWGTIKDLVAAGLLHPHCEKTIRIDKSDQDSIGKELLLHIALRAPSATLLHRPSNCTVLISI